MSTFDRESSEKIQRSSYNFLKEQQFHRSIIKTDSLTNYQYLSFVLFLLVSNLTPTWNETESKRKL